MGFRSMMVEMTRTGSQLKSNPSTRGWTDVLCPTAAKDSTTEITNATKKVPKLANGATAQHAELESELGGIGPCQFLPIQGSLCAVR